MNASKAEAIARIRCDYGVDGVLVRPMFGKWVILHVTSEVQAETIFSASTKEECDEIVRLAAKEAG